MSSIRNLADVKKQYGQKVVETATSFVVNAYGKYQPNVSFVLAKDFSGDPLKYRGDAPTSAMVAQLGLDFGTSESSLSVLFGDFWLSQAKKPHFRPRSPQVATHVMVAANWGGVSNPRLRGRWSAPEGTTYFRRAASNGGGVGIDYYVLPIGYYFVKHDEELDGERMVVPDFSERAASVRAAYEQYDREQADKATAEASAKANAEVASRAAKAGFLSRLQAVQLRLGVLEGRQYKLELGDTYYTFGSDKLYTEENVASLERSVTGWEEELAERLRKQQARAEFQPQFEELSSRAEALGLSLSFNSEKVNWENAYYGGYSYDQEGLDSLTRELCRREEEASKKEREAADAAAKALVEASAAELGLPSNVKIWRRMGGVTNRGNGWVVMPDGNYREADSSPTQGNLVWNQILVGELVLSYNQADRYDIPHCAVVHHPEAVTPRQLAAAKQIEEEMGASENAFGLDDRLAQLLERRIAAIKEAMLDLPQPLQPEDEWGYQRLVSANGIAVTDGRTWVNYAGSFGERCEGRDAQVVYVLPAADGQLLALAYDKWGGWNVNLVWRETTDDDVAAEGHNPNARAGKVEEAEESEVEPDMETALALLQNKFKKS